MIGPEDREAIMQPKQSFEELKQEISVQHAKLSRRLRQIAEFAIAEPDHTALETVASIAAKAHVPPSSLIRFAKHFGYDGFTDMQRVFRSRLIDRASSYNQRIREFRSGQPADMGSPLGVLRHFVEADAAALDSLGRMGPGAMRKFRCGILFTWPRCMLVFSVGGPLGQSAGGPWQGVAA